MEHLSLGDKYYTYAGSDTKISLEVTLPTPWNSGTFYRSNGKLISFWKPCFHWLKVMLHKWYKIPKSPFNINQDSRHSTNCAHSSLFVVFFAAWSKFIVPLSFMFTSLALVTSYWGMHVICHMIAGTNWQRTPPPPPPPQKKKKNNNNNNNNNNK